MHETLTRKAKAFPPALGRQVQADLDKGLKYAVPAGGFKTAKAAEQWARKNDLADFADFKGVKPEIATGYLRSIADHLRDFPELRKNMGFVGSSQGYNRRLFELAVEQRADTLMEMFPEKYRSRGAALDYARKTLKKPRVAGKHVASAWNSPLLKGLGINQAWAKDPDKLKSTLAKLEKSGWFPVGGGSVKAVFDHELGHQLDYLLELRKNSTVRRVFADWRKTAGKTGTGLSGYAATDIAEFIAESWSEFRNNPAPRTVARQMGEYILKKYREFKRNG